MNKQQFIDLSNKIAHDINIAEKIRSLINDVVNGKIPMEEFDPSYLIAESNFIPVSKYGIIDDVSSMIYHMIVYTFCEDKYEAFYSERIMYNIAKSINVDIDTRIDETSSMLYLKYIRENKDDIWDKVLSDLNSLWEDSIWLNNIPDTYCLPDIDELINFILIDRVTNSSVENVKDYVHRYVVRR